MVDRYRHSDFNRTFSLVYNNLPMDLRKPDLSYCRFRQSLYRRF